MTRYQFETRIVQVFRSESGWMAAVWNVECLTKFVFGFRTQRDALQAIGTKFADQTSSYQHCQKFEKRMLDLAAGAEDDFQDIELDVTQFTPFQRRVLEQCRRISSGQTLTYAEVARRVGRPGAARAVGNVMASNPFPLIVPCHRVVGSAGRLGGYSGPAGLATKRALLKREGALQQM